MSPERARRVALVLAAGRCGLGAALLASPRLAAHWLGHENASHPAVEDLARGLAARDLALGVAMISTLGDRHAGPRIQLMCGVADAADALATVLAWRSLPRKGALGTLLIAGGSAAGAGCLSRRLARS